MFKYIYDIRYCDYKDFENVKTSTILDAIQEVAIRNSEYAGFGIESFIEMGVSTAIPHSATIYLRKGKNR